MPIRSPQLDDLRYDQVVEDLIRRIPVHTPEWTNHNESDPGITLIHLFAHLTELTGYRLNRIPEKNHVELLKLLGIQLEPARAARTLLAFLLADPPSLKGFTLVQGARAKAEVGEEPPTFETDTDLDVVPAQPVALLTTESQELWRLGPLDPGEEPPEDPNDNEFLTVVWDGDKPKLEDLPRAPLDLFPRPAQSHLWLGLDYNDNLNAGFLGVRVTLHLQFDDDEVPDLTAAVECRRSRPVGEAPPAVDWLHYFDADAGRMRPVVGRIDDTSEHLQRSGSLRFTVPSSLGPIPPSMFEDLREATELTPLEGCGALAVALDDSVGQITPEDDRIAFTQLQTALTDAVTDAQAKAAEVEPAVPHPLDPKLRDPTQVRGWLRLDLPEPLPPGWTTPRLRITTFNAAPATHAETITSELLGNGTGRPGQRFQLAHDNVLGAVRLAIDENPGQPLVPWLQVPSLDARGPDERVFVLDAEAGSITFGDGLRGRIPPLVVGGGSIIARHYRHGGGKAGEVGVATITSLETPHVGLAAVTNPAAARGGADAETLDGAKERARRELKTRSRAVTADDFEFIASRTPGVRVARVVVIPRARPLQASTGRSATLTAAAATLTAAAATLTVAASRCGTLPSGPAGLEDGLVAHGAVSVVVVPDEDGPEPVPTPSFLRAVCEHLDRHRLVTTEVHVVPPQYARLCRFRIEVRARPGYTRSHIQTLVEEKLAGSLHVLHGGEDGAGFPFGTQIHVADLIALVLRTEGVERVEFLSAQFTRTKTTANPRQGELVLCPSQTHHFDRIALAPEECVSVDITTLNLSTVV